MEWPICFVDRRRLVDGFGDGIVLGRMVMSIDSVGADYSISARLHIVLHHLHNSDPGHWISEQKSITRAFSKFPGAAWVFLGARYLEVNLSHPRSCYKIRGAIINDWEHPQSSGAVVLKYLAPLSLR
jgi:hypothetical protein